MSATQLDLHRIDGAVARAASDLRRSLSALRASDETLLDDELVASPLGSNRVCSPRLLGELGRADDLLGAAVAAHVRGLIIERSCWELRVDLERSWRREPPTRGKLAVSAASPRLLLRRLLRDRPPERRARAAEALELAAGALSAEIRDFALRRAELEAELDGRGGSVGARVDVACLGAAERLLAATDDAARAFAGARGSWWSVLVAALAEDAAEGWPARLTERWLGEEAGRVGWLRGRIFDWPRLPSAVGGMSFVRAYGELGGALSDGAAARAPSFALWDGPGGLRRATTYGLFASVPLELAYHTRVLGIGRDRAREQVRRLARGAIFALRLEASRTLGGAALVGSAVAWRECSAELTERVLGEMKPSLGVVVPRAAPAEPLRLAGLVLAFLERQRMIERYDEDWFRNPRSAEAVHDFLERFGAPAAPGDVERAAAEVAAFLIDAAA